MVWGTNDLLSVSVEQDSDNRLSLKLLLCLGMALCSRWFGLSTMDRSLSIICCCAADVSLSSCVPTTEHAFLTSLSRCASDNSQSLSKKSHFCASQWLVTFTSCFGLLCFWCDGFVTAMCDYPGEAVSVKALGTSLAVQHWASVKSSWVNTQTNDIEAVSWLLSTGKFQLDTL